MFLLVLVLDRSCPVLILWPRLSLISASAGMASKPEVVAWGPVTKKTALVVVACFLSLYETFDQNKHFLHLPVCVEESSHTFLCNLCHH